MVIFQNINFKHFNRKTENIFIEIELREKYKFLQQIYLETFSKKGSYKLNFIDNSSIEGLLNSANKLVHYGWKKEAIPTSKIKKSLIARFFDAVFG